MCKMAHYDNCDPETADQEYCISHKPNKTEEEAKEFWEKFLKRFKPRVEEIEVEGKKIKRLVFEEPVDARGFVFPKNPKRVDWFITYTDTKSGNSWIGRFPFEHALFAKGAVFWNATFEGVTSFSGAVFKGVEVKLDRNNPLFDLFGAMTGKISAIFNETRRISAIFDEAKFFKAVSFENAHFEGNAFFNNVSFLDGATFSNAVFEKESMFTNSKFEIREIKSNIEFAEELLSENPIPLLKQLKISGDFNGTHFKGQVYFDNSHLMGALFTGATFRKDSSFRGANFNGLTIFTQTNFIGKADFSGVKFHEDVTFSSKNVQFSEDLFLDMYMYERLTIQSATFYDEANFLEAKFYGNADFGKVKFKKGANFALCEFYKAVDFQNCEFLETKANINPEKYPYPKTTFAKAKFKGDALFTLSIFGTAIFNFSVFESGASFKNATFYDEARFIEVEFKRTIEFHSAEFRNNVLFNGSVFERLIVFTENPEDKSKKREHTLRQLPRFWGNLSFSNCDFRQGVRFVTDDNREDGKNINGMDFIKHIIKSALALENPLIEEFLSMFVRKERDTTYYMAIKEAARVQRLSFEKEGKKEEADSMFLIEMRAIRELRRLKSRKFLLFEYFLELVLGDWIALYGTKGRRILLGSILVMGPY